MDKQLLKALDNLSDALEMIAEVLAQKSEEDQSATTTALQSGDFSKTIEEINLGVKAIKVDTEEILKNQKTIIDLQKKKESDKKGGIVEEAGVSKEQENKLKTGIGIILLIAIAVLAIGMAFKLVGKIDFLSVIGLSIAILVMAVAFEKVAKLKISLREAFETSAVLVFIAIAITVSSWIMKLIAPIGFTQFLTAVFISITFAAMSKYLENIFLATIIFKRLRVKSTDLIKTLVAISAAITVSSWIMRLIMPISFAQGLTAILISVTFAIIAMNFEKIAIGVSLFENTGVKPKDLLMVMLGIAAAITVSSWIMRLIIPLSIGQLITGVLISTMFLLISFNLEKIAIGVIAFKKTGVKAKDLLLVMVGIAAAITVSSWVMQLIMPIGLWQFVTALGITILFAIMSYIMPELAGGIALVGKLLGVNKVFLIPLVMVAISLAIMLSSLLLQFTAPIPFMELLRILVFSVVLAIAVVVLGLASFILIKVFGFNNIIKGSIAIIALSFAIKWASLLISEGKYDIYPDWNWTLQSGIAIAGFGLVSWFLNKLGGVTSYIKGGLSIIVVSAVIMATSHILNLGKYGKYPKLEWVLGVGAGLAAFGIAAVLLGTQALNPFFYAGLGIILLIAGTIVKTSKKLSEGKYNIPGFTSWATAVVLLYSVFTPIILILGTVGVAAAALGAIFGDGANPFEKGREMLGQIAQTIVDVAAILAEGKFVGGPTKEWAEGVGIAIGAFSPVYAMMVRSAIFEALGMAAVGPEEFNASIRTVVGGIVAAADAFAGAKGSFEEGPSETWAKGVGSAIGAFAPVYQSLILAGITGDESLGPEGMVKAVETMTRGIIKSAEIFGENKAKFEEGNYPSENWGKGVGAALNAFSPVFESLNKKKWWQSGDDIIDNMSKGIRVITSSIVSAAIAFSGYTYDPKTNKWSGEGGFSGVWSTYPTKEWGDGVSSSVDSFLGIFEMIGKYSLEDFISKSQLVNFAIISMSSAARVLYANKEYFTFQLEKSFIENMSANILGFAKLALELDKLLIVEKEVTTTTGGFFGFKTETKTVRERRDLALVKDIATQFVTTAAILFHSKEYFTFQLEKSFIENMSTNILGFAKLALELDKLLIVEKEVTTTTGGFFGFKTETKTVRERRDLALAKDVATQLVTTAAILFYNKELFGDLSNLEEFNKKVVSLDNGIIMKYATLGLILPDSSLTYPVISTARSLVRMAKILHSADDAFSLNIDPNYMKNVSQNMLDFNEFVKKLAESESEGGNIIGSSFSRLFGLDPISQIADRMVTLAKGYDAMANALIKLSTAMRMINVNSMRELGGFTRSLLGKSPAVSKEGTGQTPTFRRNERDESQMPSVSSGSKEKAIDPFTDPKKNSISYVSEKLEELIKIMAKIERSTSTIDEAVEQVTGIKPPPEISDFS